jgi:hypothetical protein
MFLKFLKEFAALSRSEQQVFLYCLEKCPFPRKKSSDLNFIAQSLGLSYKTTWKAIKVLSSKKAFNRVVKYINLDIHVVSMEAGKIERFSVDLLNREGRGESEFLG